MKSLFLSLFIISSIVFASCTKKAGPLKACFTFSKSVAKVNDTIYILNCSENYAKFKWLIPFQTPDSINKHTYVVPSAVGDLPVGLLVWDLDQVDTTGLVKILSVK